MALGIGALIVLLVAEADLALAVFARGRWTMRLAWINAGIAVCVMSLGLTALGRGVLYNPRFVDEVFVSNGVDSDAVIVLAVLSGIAIVGVTVATWSTAGARPRGHGPLERRHPHLLPTPLPADACR